MTENLNHIQNPETPSTESEVIEQTKKGVDEIKSQIEKQRTTEKHKDGELPIEIKKMDPVKLQKLDKLSKDPECEKGFSKIIEKCLTNRINTFKGQYEPKERKLGLDIESYTRQITKKHPGLKHYLCGDLGLPYDDSDVPGFGTKFSELSFYQKLGFMAVYETTSYYKGDMTKFTPTDFIKRCNGYIEDCEETIEFNLRNTITSNSNATLVTDIFDVPKILKDRNSVKDAINFVNLESVLENNYGLNKTESKKVREYITLAEEIVMDNAKEQIKQAASLKEIKEILQIILYVTIAILTIYGIYKISSGIERLSKKFGDANPYTKDETIKHKGGIVEVTSFKELDKLVVGEAYCASLTKDEKGNRRERGHLIYEYKPIKPKKEKGGIIGRIERGAAKIYNEVEGVTLKIDVEEQKVQYSFDAKTLKVKFIPDENGKYRIEIKTKKPKLEPLATKYKVIYSDGQFIETKAGREWESRCLEDIQAYAIEEAEKPERMNKAKESLGNNILNHYNEDGFYTSTAQIEGGKFSSVTVEYED